MKIKIKITYDSKYEKYFEFLILNLDYNYGIKEDKIIKKDNEKIIIYEDASNGKDNNILSEINRLRNSIDEEGNSLRFKHISVYNFLYEYI